MLSKYDLAVDKAARERGCEWTAPNGPGFAGLYAGDVVEFTRPVPSHLRGVIPGKQLLRASVLPLLVFADHVLVKHGPHGAIVDASNFVRLVRRGKRHMAAQRAQLASWGVCKP